MQMYLFSITPNVLKYIYWSSEDIWIFRKNTSEVVEEIKHYIHSHKIHCIVYKIHYTMYCYDPLLSISWVSLLFTTMGRQLGREHFASLPPFPFPLHLLPAHLPQVWLLGIGIHCPERSPRDSVGGEGRSGGLTQQIGQGGAHLTAEDLHIDYHIVKQQKSSKRRCFADFMVIVHFSPQMPVCYYFVLWLIQKLVN